MEEDVRWKAIEGDFAAENIHFSFFF